MDYQDVKKSKYDQYREEIRLIKGTNPLIQIQAIANILIARHQIPSDRKESLRKYVSSTLRDVKQFKTADIETDKKTGTFDWREWTKHIQERQQLRHKASFSQLVSDISVKTKHQKIIILPLSDLHIGSIATDYDKLVEFTDAVLSIPNLYMVLPGDNTDNFVKFKTMGAIFSQAISPDEQDAFFMAWLKEIKHKVLFACWDNHSQMEERETGKNRVRSILNNSVVFLDGIGKATVKINEIPYKFAITHKTRRWSALNKTHGLKVIAREDIRDADIYLGGDRHCAAMEVNREGGVVQVFIQSGTLKTNDKYGQQYFSHFCHADMPCVVLDTTKKQFTPFWTLQEAIEFSR